MKLRRAGSLTNGFLKGIFSKWFFLIYFGLGGVYLTTFPLLVRNVTLRIVLFQVLGLMSGSDPFTFREVIESHLTLWVLAWLIHIASWLLIPALIALIVADARDDIRKGQSLDTGFAGLAADAGVESESIPAVVKQLNTDIEKALKEILGKGIKQ